MTDWGDEIAKATKDALSAMPKDELAYLALTTKSEGPMRDRIAFHLHKKHEDSKFWVAREWSKRIDLAFVKREDLTPICLVELKAIYVVDALLKKKDGRPWFVGPVEKDLDKLKKTDAPNKFGLILATHVHKDVPENLKGIVKEYEINRVFEKYKGDSQIILEKAVAKIREIYGERIVCEGDVAAGRTFKLLDVTLYYWLIRPAG
jgi:hypothetical protein